MSKKLNTRRGPKELIGNKLNLRHHQPWHFGTELLQPWGKRDCCSVENVFFFGVEWKSPVLKLWHFKTEHLTLGLWKPAWLDTRFLFELCFFGLHNYLYFCCRNCCWILDFGNWLRNWPWGVDCSLIQARLGIFVEWSRFIMRWGWERSARKVLVVRSLTSNLVTRKLDGWVSPPSLERLCQYKQLLVVSPFHITYLQI